MTHKPTPEEQAQGMHACGCVVDIETGVYRVLCSEHWWMKKDQAYARFTERATEVDYIG